ncbi:acetate--CoA ligase [Candidatus Pacearchaeota archaeon]|mgnify:CR=1 FL=1|jgi:acetyl-CoA synthetase|nr:acetate--CoA ligase [Candidatus Pacearchaeota archaeon]|tara:strand:- start:7210 stop:9135 length:1926 start_codon:yes stop_codon:yes gene_type:complete
MTKYVIKKSGKFWPSKEMKKIAWINDSKIYKEADKNPIKFWEKLAKEGITWEKSWKKTYEQKLPYFWWFKGGKLNFSYNCIDRHLKNKSDKVALIWIPEPTKEKPIKLTYKQIYEKVNKFANVLKKQGVKKGDVVAIYLPMIPEALIAMLACTRLGAIHSVVFSAFSADALQARIKDGKSKLLITADEYYRKGEKEDLLKKAKQAIIKTSVKKVIVVTRLRKRISGKKFLNFEKEIKKENSYYKPEIMNSEDPLFILYTSGTTGMPKGIVHDTGGYATQAYLTTKWNFNLRDNDIMWCTADIGWITGHTYAFYGPLLNGGTTLIYEGAPDFPNFSRWWKIINQNKVNVFYTAPTAIRMFMKAGDKYLKNHIFSSLKILGTVGEPIDKNAWMWYFRKIGKNRCPIIDTWWQTETGGTLINALPGIGPFIPTVAGKSFPGTRHIIVNEKGKQVKSGKTGSLVQLSPFAPGMLHGIYRNHKKYIDTYWKRFKNKYDTSDGAYVKSNLIRLTGRTDDVMKVAGHRLATAELENAINEHKLVNESAIIPIPDKIKGQVPIAFVILKSNKPSLALEKQIIKHVDKKIGPTARLAKIYFVEDLPKTRSGKIMRRILKSILVNEKPKGLQTLINPQSVNKIKTRIFKKI